MESGRFTLAGALAATLLLSSFSVASDDGRDFADAQSVSTATYVVTFASTWSSQTHPVDFPPNPHFSGLIGGTHNQTIAFWEVGASASDGIESMAETGSKTLLQNEVNAAINAGAAEHVLSGGGIGVSPGSVALTFDVSSSFPLVTLVSMLAPSPDWFVGVSALSLQDQGSWVQSMSVPLVLYDAGSDSGTTYRAANEDTDPPADITPLTASPFDQNNVVGTFTFELQSVVSVEGVREVPDASFEISPPFPNPFSEVATLDIRATRADDLEVALYDASGRMVRRLYSGYIRDRERLQVRVDASGLSSGYYLVRAAGRHSSGIRGVVLIR